MTSAQNLQPQSSGNKRPNRHWLRLIFILFLLFSAMLAACGGEKNKDSNDQEQSNNNAPTLDPTPRARVTVSRASVYTTPDREAPAVMSLVEGDEVVITAQTPPDALGAVFYFVQIGDQIGWILSSQVEITGNAANLPVLQEPAINTFPTNDPSESLDATLDPATVLIRTTADDTPMYSTPSASSAVLITLVQDVEFLPVYHTPPDETGIIYYGVEVPIDGRRRVGWLASTTVEVTGDTSTLVLIVTPTPTLPITDEASTTMAQAATTPPPTETPSPSLTLTTSPETSPESPTPTQQSATIPITPTLTLEPSATSIPLPSATPTALIRRTEPPIDIAIPDTWDSDHFIIPVQSSIPGGDTELTLSKYEGPLPNGANGYIWVFSGFSNLVPLGARFDLYPDANLILRSLLFNGCNIGLDVEERTIYPIGPHLSIGARYVAVGCEDNSPDIAGWFAALPVDGRNYVFFVGIEPPSRELENTSFFQDLFDTVQFLN